MLPTEEKDLCGIYIPWFLSKTDHSATNRSSDFFGHLSGRGYRPKFKVSQYYTT